MLAAAAAAAPRSPFTQAPAQARQPRQPPAETLAPCWQAYCEQLQSGGLIASVAEEGED